MPDTNAVLPLRTESPARRVDAAQRARNVVDTGLVVGSDDALLEEYEALFGDAAPAGSETERRAWLRDRPKAALCLSGGGIRSAAFCMGALRALSANSLLVQFHYLSTVSGGGYIGAWLQQIARRLGGVPGAEAILKGSQGM